MSAARLPATRGTVPRMRGCHAIVGPLQSAHADGLRAANLRPGARQDRVLRTAARHADGTQRGPVLYSTLDTEWPAVRRTLQARLEAHA